MKRQHSHTKTLSSPKYLSPPQNREAMRQITQNDEKLPKSPTLKAQYYQSFKKMRTQQSSVNKSSGASILASGAKTARQNTNSSMTSQSVSKIDQYQLMEQIGSGKFGKVLKCQHKTSKKIFALKFINKQQIKKQKIEHQLQREVTIQLNLCHPNILKLYDFFDTPEEYCLLLEYATGGSLFQTLVSQQCKRYSEPAAANIVKQIARGIQDLKPENILWCDGVIKLSDFGWSIQNREERQTLCGTLDYLPPEMVYGQSYDGSVDIWSLGVLIYELTTGKTPFQIHEGFKLQFPDHLSSDAKDLMRGLLQEKQNRKSLDWAMKHVWLS